MNTPDTAPDDSHWSSLAHELGLDSDPAPAAPQPLPTPVEISHDPTAPAHHDQLPDAADEEDTLLEPPLAGEPVAEAAEGDEAEGDDQPGEGGKRRRRRRRRRRKGGPEGAATPAAEGEEPVEEGVAEEDDEQPVASETPSHDAMRDVIANWNVPSWDELIGGLYRPGG